MAKCQLDKKLGGRQHSKTSFGLFSQLAIKVEDMFIGKRLMPWGDIQVLLVIGNADIRMLYKERCWQNQRLVTVLVLVSRVILIIVVSSFFLVILEILNKCIVFFRIIEYI